MLIALETMRLQYKPYTIFERYFECFISNKKLNVKVVLRIHITEVMRTLTSVFSSSFTLKIISGFVSMISNISVTVWSSLQKMWKS